MDYVPTGDYLCHPFIRVIGDSDGGVEARRRPGEMSRKVAEAQRRSQRDWLREGAGVQEFRCSVER